MDDGIWRVTGDRAAIQDTALWQVRRWAASGYTFVELLVVATIVLILASAIMPLARVTAARSREAELRRALREIRTAIDKYKDW